MFHSARIKLTAWYLLIIMTISIIFSVVIYRVLISEMERFSRIQRFRAEQRLHEGEFFLQNEQYRRFSSPILNNPELVKEMSERILLILIFVNGGILVISGGLGYFLAGRTLTPIKEMVEEQNHFISDASHEFRTPLTSLKTAFEVFLRNKQPTVQNAKTLVKESISEVNKLQSLSDSLLQLAQYQKPNGNSQFHTLSLSQVIDNAIRKIEPIAKKQDIEIVKNLTDLEIVGNKYSLEDLMVILLDNAVKYSPKGAKVDITTNKTDGSVHIYIQDYGLGIEKKDLPNIFNRFYRTDMARSKGKTGGYGLGLSIAQKITQAHNGSIQVKSTPKKGSTFTVSLPINQRKFGRV